jgi:metallo-beta-lactamase class B
MRRFLLITTAAVAVAAPVVAQSPPAWTQAVAPYRVVGNVYFVGTEGLSAFLITTPQGHVLLDGGLPSNAPQILASVRALGFRPADVKILLNSHAHFDHAGGLAALKQATGATLYASAEDRASLDGGIHIGDNENGAARFPAVKVDRVVRDGETVRLGPVALTAHVTPGHTRGCTTWTLPVVEAGRSHQAVFHCSTTVAGNRLVGNRRIPRSSPIIAEASRG